MKNNLDVLVIGGGAIGICSAHYLSEQGLRITVLEQSDVASGCSEGNGGLIVPSACIPMAEPGVFRHALKWMLNPGSPFYIKPRFDPTLFYWLRRFRTACKTKNMHKGLRALSDLNSAGLGLFDQLISQESLACHYRKDGWLRVYRSDKGYREALEKTHLLESHGVKLKALNLNETLEMAPQLKPGISGGIFFPDDAHLDPARFIKELAKRLIERGVDIQTHAEVLKFETSGSLVSRVQSTHGDFYPNQVVLATGAWTSRLVRNLGVNLPVQPAKGYSISIKKPEESPDIPLYLNEAKVVVTPLEKVLRLAGTLELSGMDFKINLCRVDAIMQASKKYLRLDHGLDIVETWRGLRPCSPDGLPIIDYAPGYKNLILATGHGMLGMTLAPGTGRLVSQIICEQSPEVNLTPFSSNRFN
ncbi:NAD(P)/FAD-dependent oxidoreductase [Acidobacteriota bacterium]